MTNVLIGIIGVILFIGLALAGAIFLGPKFQDAKVNSQAMSLTQMSSQVTMALSLRRGEAGVPFVARDSVTVLAGDKYLKVTPLNPYIGEGGWPFRVLYSGDVRSNMFYADIVFVSLGHALDSGEVCRSINRQIVGRTDIPQLPKESGSDVSSMLTQLSGCFQLHEDGIPGEANPNDYIVYTRI